MVHPDRLAVPHLAQARQQRRFFRNDDVGAAEFAMMAAFDLAAKAMRHFHFAIADTQYGHVRLENGLGRARGALFHRGCRSARQDDGLRLLGQRLVRLVEGHDLAINAGFANTAGNQLGDLAAKIQNKDTHGLAITGRLVSSSAAIAFRAAGSDGSITSAAS